MKVLHALLAFGVLAALAACGPKQEALNNDTQTNVVSPAPEMPPVEPAKPDKLVELSGYGPLQVGITVADLKALPGTAKIDRMDPRDPENTCGFASLSSFPGLSMMLSGDEVVRVEFASADYPTAAGARVGMSENEVKALYGDVLQVQPHPYTGPTGHYLVYHQPNAPLGMIFETDGKKVLNYRVGRWTEVQYVEGCS